MKITIKVHYITELFRAAWTTVPAEIVQADDTRATVIATSTNLLQRQDLSIVERGKAYKALLDAKNRNGQHHAACKTLGDNHQRYNARQIVAEFFGVTEYEIRKAVKLTNLVPSLLDIMEEDPRRLNLACAGIIADYDQATQAVFVEDGLAAGKISIPGEVKKVTTFDTGRRVLALPL